MGYIRCCLLPGLDHHCCLCHHYHWTSLLSMPTDDGSPGLGQRTAIPISRDDEDEAGNGCLQNVYSLASGPAAHEPGNVREGLQHISMRIVAQGLTEMPASKAGVLHGLASRYPTCPDASADLIPCLKSPWKPQSLVSHRCD